MVELADVAALAFIGVGLIFQSVRYLRSDRQIKVSRGWLISLKLDETALSRKYSLGVVLVFNRTGYLVRKFPEVDVVKRKGQCGLRCSVEEGSMNFCVLFAPHKLTLSGVYSREDVDRLFGGNPDIQIFETGTCDIKCNSLLQLTTVPKDISIEISSEVIPMVFSMLLPPEVITDAMAKDLPIDLNGCSEKWEIGNVCYLENNSDNWLFLKREGEKLVLQFRTNFASNERIAMVELHTEECTHTLKVRQQMMSMHTKLTVNCPLYVTAGRKNEMVPFSVTLDNEQMSWFVKAANANDGGCWYTVQPLIGMRQKGSQVLKIYLEAKPVNVRSRSLSLTLETGTYPFCDTTEIVLIQGVCFDYYIEYPQDDVCARHSGVIETPLDYREADGLKAYMICVDSNQPWRIIRDKQVDWVEVDEPELLQGHYNGRFIVRVHSNEGNAEHSGFSAARYTVLSLVNDTGVVKDILIYQGGYVRIRGKYWLDRNLAAEGKLAQVAIPVGMGEGSTLNHGSYFQFGSRTDVWTEHFTPCKGGWHAGKAENQLCISQIDPSPVGWRIPSYIEMQSLMNAPVASLELQREEVRNHVCLLSDDGVPIYLPLCGHRSHINGCRIMIPHGHRYWTGSSQGPVYGYSLCVESSRQMYIVHDMKKYGFPVRCILG